MNKRTYAHVEALLSGDEGISHNSKTILGIMKNYDLLSEIPATRNGDKWDSSYIRMRIFLTASFMQKLSTPNGRPISPISGQNRVCYTN